MRIEKKKKEKLQTLNKKELRWILVDWATRMKK